MIIIISPAKTIDFESEIPVKGYTIPRFTDKADFLANELRKLRPGRLAALMKISPKLAKLNEERYATWHLTLTLQNSRQALYAFRGDVYDGLNAFSLGEEQVGFAQEHLRILSGLYGLLRPLDLILPHRLEMGIPFSTRKGKDLYTFWDNRIAKILELDMKQTKSKELINLASQEYFKAVGKHLNGVRIITPSFKEFHNGQYKMMNFFAKKARGLMARFIIEHQVGDPEQIKTFDYAGYLFNPGLSKADDWSFTRGEVKAAGARH